MTPKIHSGKSFSLAVALFIVLAIIVDRTSLAIGQSPTDSANQFQASAPVMTFLDMYTGQPWARYVVSESVTVPKYEYREVKDKVWVPTWVQEPKQTATTQYDQIVSYQLRPRSVPSANPFAPPQQIVEYVPIVQYQPRNVQTTQMTAYQKYEEREVSRMVPVLVNASEQRQRFVDRPLSASGTPGVASSNLIQDSAMLAQANRTTARYPTRSIDYPAQPTYGSPVYGYTASNTTWNAPVTIAPPPAMYAQQYAARQAATAPIVPISSQTTAPTYPPVYAGTGTPIPPPSGPPSMPPYPAASYPPSSYAAAPPPAGYPQAGYPPAGYPQAGYPQAGYPQAGYPQAGYPQAGYPQSGYPQSGYPQSGYPMAGYPQSGYPQSGYPMAGYPPAGYPQAGYPPAGYPPSPYGYPPSPYGASPYGANAYAAWYMRQGALFPTTMFGTTAGQSSMVSGGYPYKGYPPGAVPPAPSGYGYPTSSYGAPQMASNPMGVSSNAPNFWGRTTLPFNSNGYPTGSY